MLNNRRGFVDGAADNFTVTVCLTVCNLLASSGPEGLIDHGNGDEFDNPIISGDDDGY